MNPDRQQAIDYLSAPAGGLWRWAEDGRVVVWHDGTTVAFREEILRILEALAPNDLPSFGAIVFLLAACRGKVPVVSDLVPEAAAALPPELGSKASLLLTARAQLKAQLAVGLAELAKVAQLPAEIRAHLPAKCVLAAAVFEAAKVERYVEARAVLRGAREPMNEGELTRDDQYLGRTGSYVRQVHIVAEGLKPHTTESLLLRLRTGLDELPKPAEAELPVTERARRLIEELSRQREYGFLARAARELMAAVRLPRRLQEREQLAIGGVSDISNRGPLDRLLLSELAHDDLTLAVRVALNEALYLRREPPLREPPGTLALLLDSGVRLWGVPRILAAALALAFVACDKQHSRVVAWRARGKQIQEVDLLSREGLVQHLGALAPTAHPAEALQAFGEAVAPLAGAQSVVMTEPDALRDAEFRRALAANPAAPGFVATVDRAGRFELHTLPLARRPPVCEADLDIDALFETKSAVSLFKRSVDPSLPAIFGITPFPFLLPLAGGLDFWTEGPDGISYGVLEDRRLVQFRGPGCGARVLASELPHGRTLWMGCVEDTVYVLKSGSTERPARLLSRSVPDGPLRVFDLASGPEILAVHRYGEVIVLLREYDVRAYSLHDGRLRGQVRNPYQWCHGRFLRGPSHMHFALWDGSQIKLDPITMPLAYSPSVISKVFDREGIDGPWLVLKSGIVVSTATGEQVTLPLPPGRSATLRDVRLSRNGHRVYFSVSADWHRVKDLKLGLVVPLSEYFQGTPELDLPPMMPTWNVRRVVHSVATAPIPSFCWGRKKNWSTFQVEKKAGQARLTTFPADPQTPRQGSAVSFEDRPQMKAPGCALRTVELQGGLKVFLDDRGLLHFKNHDPKIPEVSLVLCHNEMAGWTSDGHVCGPKFFFEGEYVAEPEAVYDRLMACFKPL